MPAAPSGENSEASTVARGRSPGPRTLGLVVSLLRCASRLRIAIYRRQRGQRRSAPWLAGGILALVLVPGTALHPGGKTHVTDENLRSSSRAVTADGTGQGSISGVVTDEASGAPLEGMCVSVVPAYVNVRTDSTGHFTIDALDAGSYTVSFGDCANRPPLYLTEWYDNKPNCQACDPVNVGAGASVVGIDAALTKGGAITGTVTNEQTGAFLYPAGVDVYDLSGTVRQWTYNDSIAGRYAIGPLPAGQYKIRFSLNYPLVAPHLPEWYSDMHDFGSAGLVDIGPGTVAVIDASLTGINHGDVDCNGKITAVDALKLLRFAAGFYPPYVQGCPYVGGSIWTSLWGDVDCSATVDGVDALKVLRFISGLPVAQNEPCRRIGQYWGNPPS